MKICKDNFDLHPPF